MDDGRGLTLAVVEDEPNVRHQLERRVHISALRLIALAVDLGFWIAIISAITRLWAHH